jgi:hypothetical protein
MGGEAEPRRVMARRVGRRTFVPGAPVIRERFPCPLKPGSAAHANSKCGVLGFMAVRVNARYLPGERFAICRQFLVVPLKNSAIPLHDVVKRCAVHARNGESVAFRQLRVRPAVRSKGENNFSIVVVPHAMGELREDVGVVRFTALAGVVEPKTIPGTARDCVRAQRCNEETDESTLQENPPPSSWCSITVKLP